MNTVTHSLTDEHATVMHLPTNLLIHVNTQKHKHTLPHWRVNRLHSLLQTWSHTSTSYTFTHMNMLTDLLPFIDRLTHAHIRSNTNILNLTWLCIHSPTWICLMYTVSLIHLLTCISLLILKMFTPSHAQTLSRTHKHGCKFLHPHRHPYI